MRFNHATVCDLAWNDHSFEYVNPFNFFILYLSMFIVHSSKGYASNQNSMWIKNQAIHNEIIPTDNIAIFTVQVHFMSRLFYH